MKAACRRIRGICFYGLECFGGSAVDPALGSQGFCGIEMLRHPRDNPVGGETVHRPNEQECSQNKSKTSTAVCQGFPTQPTKETKRRESRQPVERFCLCVGGNFEGHKN